MPDQTFVGLGSEADATGLQILVHYNDGTMEIVDSGYTVSPKVFEELGMQDVWVTYEGKTLTYSVMVEEPTVDYICLHSRPAQTSYTVGAMLNTTGLEVLVAYSDGSTELIDSGYTVTPRRLNQPGTTLITVTYEGKTVSFYVTVKE